MFVDSNVRDVFFTSDTHFGHKNIIKYCNRPFEDVKQMDERLIENWNQKVPKNAIVFHLGDFAFIKEKKNYLDLVDSLNGDIVLVEGNHDGGIHRDVQRILRDADPQQDKFTIAPSLYEVDIQVEDEKLRFVLCHYAMRVWNKSHYGAIHLYGHSHGTLPDDPHSRSMDVGVDSFTEEVSGSQISFLAKTYKPFHLDEILLAMYKKTFKPVDHHDKRR